MPCRSDSRCSSGRHADPGEGSCLMEYVSVLAGGRFSDHPRCTHPLLTWAARRINDTVSDTARPLLATLTPDLIGTRAHRRRTRKAVQAVIYAELARRTRGRSAPSSPARVNELALAHWPGADGCGRWARSIATTCSRPSSRRWAMWSPRAATSCCAPRWPPAWPARAGPRPRHPQRSPGGVGPRRPTPCGERLTRRAADHGRSVRGRPGRPIHRMEGATNDSRGPP